MQAFSDRLEAYYRANRTHLIRAFRSWGAVEYIDEAIQEAMVRIYTRYGAGDEAEPNNLNALVRVTIRNILTDGFRRATVVGIGDVRVGADGSPVLAAPSDDDTADDFSSDPALPSKFVSPEDETAWKQLLRRIFDELDAKWVRVASLVMIGTSPDEIGAEFGQNGYVLRRYARSLVCRALARLTGDPMAASLSRDFCHAGAAG